MSSSIQVDQEQLTNVATFYNADNEALATEKSELIKKLDDLIESVDSNTKLRKYLRDYIDKAIARVEEILSLMNQEMVDLRLKIEVCNMLYNQDPSNGDQLYKARIAMEELSVLATDLLTVEDIASRLKGKKSLLEYRESKEIELSDAIEQCKENVEGTQTLIAKRTQMYSALIKFVRTVFESDANASDALEQILMSLNADVKKGLNAVNDLYGVPLFLDGVNIEDINQGAIGDCWLLAVIQGIAASNPALLENMIITTGENEYRVKLFDKDGNVVFVDVNGNDMLRLLAENGRASNGSSTAAEKWIFVLEAAFAKSSHILLGRSQGDIDTGGVKDTENAYRAITGNSNNESSFIIREDPGLARRAAANFSMYENRIIGSGIDNMRTAEGTYEAIRQALDDGKTIVAGSDDSGESSGPMGYQNNHVFTVVDAYRSGGEDYVVLRNPWGAGGNGDLDPYVTVTVGEFTKYWFDMNILG